jgi:hypothetical protein
LNRPSRAVYTAIYGDYDILNPVPADCQSADIAYVCFTDNDAVAAPGWQVRVEKPRFSHPRMAAKYYKTLSHVVLPEYDATLWIDASFQIEDPLFANDAFSYLDVADIALFPHPDRGCIYDEAKVSVTMEKYTNQPIKEQVEYYLASGHPRSAGLFACGIIARSSRSTSVRKLNELWMIENIRFTYQDQLSMAYLLRRLHIRPAIFARRLWMCGWGSWQPHVHDG